VPDGLHRRLQARATIRYIAIRRFIDGDESNLRAAYLDEGAKLPQKCGQPLSIWTRRARVQQERDR